MIMILKKIVVVIVIMIMSCRFEVLLQMKLSCSDVISCHDSYVMSFCDLMSYYVIVAMLYHSMVWYGTVIAML